MGLETIVANGAKGTASGFLTAVNPVGTFISFADRENTGVGFNDKKRALPTIHNKVHQSAYAGTDNNSSMAEEFLPRYFGEGVGGLLGIGSLVGAYIAGGPLAALAVPAALGTYDAIAGGSRYVRDFVQGEKAEDSEKGEKATFGKGFKFGFNRSTLGPALIAYNLESDLGGSSSGDSRFESSYKRDAANMRRNFTASAGSFVGSALGSAASILSLGLYPLFRTFYAADEHFKTKKEQKQTAKKEASTPKEEAHVETAESVPEKAPLKQAA